MSLLLISHDLGVVSSITERVLVMQAGRCVEQGDTDQVLQHPTHAYTRKLIDARPRPEDRLKTPATAQSTTKPLSKPVLEVRSLERGYGNRAGHP
eukprot:gene43737-59231_t